MDMPMPEPVDSAPTQTSQEGGEYGSGSAGADSGAEVDGYNDKAGERPGSDTTSGMDEGAEGNDSSGDDRDNGDSSDTVDKGDQGDQEGIEDQPAGNEGGEESPSPDGSDGDNPHDRPDTPRKADGSRDANDSGQQAAGPEDNDQEADAGEDEQKPEEQSDQQDDSTSKDGKKDQEKEKDPGKDKDKQPERPDSILDRMARGDLTEKDKEILKKEKERQMNTSAVPGGSWLPKGGGGGTHANPKQSGPSALAQWQSERKAHREQQDEVQSWNDRAIQRAQAQDDAMWENLRKMNKG